MIYKTNKKKLIKKCLKNERFKNLPDDIKEDLYSLIYKITKEKNILEGDELEISSI